MADSYNSAYTGAQIDEAIALVRDNGVVRTGSQALTDAEKAQARTNIGAVGSGNTETWTFTLEDGSTVTKTVVVVV